MSLSKGISPFLWFGGKAKEAVEHYVSVFPNSRITNVIEIPAGPAKGAAQIEFELDGFTCTALDGGPMFEMTPAIPANHRKRLIITGTSLLRAAHRASAVGLRIPLASPGKLCRLTWMS